MRPTLNIKQDLIRGIVLLCLTIGATYHSGRANAALPDEILRNLHLHGIDQHELGLVVMSEENGSVRLHHYAHRAMSPASTLKTLTTIVALDTLGPNYRWNTALLATNPAQNGTLTGPIFLRGGAEPNLTWDRFGLLLRQLRGQGITQISGDIIIDRSFFNPTRYDLNVTPFDSTPTQYYNVIPDAMLVNANLIALHLDSTTSPLAIHTLPPLDGVHVLSQLTPSDEPCNDWDEEWPVPEVDMLEGNPTVVLHGTYPKNCVNQTSTNVLDRNLYIERLVRSLWQEMGGQWVGTVGDGITPQGAQIVAEHDSEALADVVKIINKRSDNTMARDLYLTLGHEWSQSHPDTASTPELAQRSVRDWLLLHHIDDTGLVLENGSGLSRIERISPFQLANVLQRAAKSTWSAEFKTSLPIMGVDGTMAHRKGQAIEAGAARIKGGTLNNTVAIAGYVTDTKGKHWIVVAIINRADAQAGRPVLDAVINWVATHPGLHNSIQRQHKGT